MYLIITSNAGNVGGISPLQAMYGNAPDIRDLRLFGCPVSAFHHHRKMKDGSFRGFASTYLDKKEGMNGKIGLIIRHSGSKVVVSNDITSGENFQWTTTVYCTNSNEPC
jgi:hypothetical protein